MAANGSSARLNATPFPSGSPRRLGHFYLLPNSVKFYIDLSLLFKDIDCVLLLYCLLAAFPRAVYLLPCTTTHGKAPNRSLPLLFAPAFRTTLFFFFFVFLYSASWSASPIQLHPIKRYRVTENFSCRRIDRFGNQIIHMRLHEAGWFAKKRKKKKVMVTSAFGPLFLLSGQRPLVYPFVNTICPMALFEGPRLRHL